MKTEKLLLKKIKGHKMGKYLSFNSHYNKMPAIHLTEETITVDIKDICQKLTENHKKTIIIDCYPGVDISQLIQEISTCLPKANIINVEDYAKSEKQLDKMLSKNITDDRVFGIWGHFKIDEFYQQEASQKVTDQYKDGVLNIIVGWGSAYLSQHITNKIVILANMARWEIQQRMRNGQPNWHCTNNNEDILRKYKRAFFIEWRTADMHKLNIIQNVDYILDANNKDKLKLISQKTYMKGLKKTLQQPFRLVPFFDPGVWGGQWMKDVCALDDKAPNYAWCFDCVPEENSLLFKINDVFFEFPSIDLVLLFPTNLLGKKTYARFGKEFPIRFDFLDTIEGQNLSLQVHPLTDYIYQEFGMSYTQDESYYMLDATDDAYIYLGIKENTNRKKLLKALSDAQETGEFDDELYINKFPAKKHDHFLIPAGTIHCSGKGSMVLEISATPYIFTFKLWDWGRLGLDGRPRPVHLKHGEKVIDWSRDTDWVKQNLINKITPVAQGNGWVEEKTGLHELEFIETRRHWFTKQVEHKTKGTVNILNLIEGEEAEVISPTNAFKPYIVHYAETFIIPADIGEYIIRPTEKTKGKPLATIKAWVRGTEC